MAAARKSATTPIGAGGEFTQPKNRGWPLPIACGKTAERKRSSMASGARPASPSASCTRVALAGKASSGGRRAPRECPRGSPPPGRPQRGRADGSARGRAQAAGSCRRARSSRSSPAARASAAWSSGSAMATELHREVVDAGLLPTVGECMAAVAGVVDAVTGAEHVLDAVERQTQGAALHREVLARARGVRRRTRRHPRRAGWSCA